MNFPDPTVGADKVNMLTHTYPHKYMRKIKVVMYNHQAGSPFYLRPDVCSGDCKHIKSVVMRDTECPH